MANRTNIFDIANDAGVSIATVSRVMNGQSNVSIKTRDKVLLAARKHGYRAHIIDVNSLRPQRRTIGVVLPLIDNPFYSKMYMKIHQEAEALQHSVMLFQARRGSNFLRTIIDDLIEHRYSGAILSGDTMEEATFEQSAEQVARLMKHMPIVLVNTPMNTSLPCLTVELSSSARIAVRHFHRLGHKRIAMIGGSGTGQYENTREYGYLDEMKSLGLEEYIYPFTSGEGPLGGSVCISRLLSQYPKEKRPTALFAFNDLVALGALRQLQKEGYHVPGDIAIVGCDNQLFSAYLTPPLSTIDLHVEDIICSAISLITDPDRKHNHAFFQAVEPSLVIRDSCGC